VIGRREPRLAGADHDDVDGAAAHDGDNSVCARIIPCKRIGGA
jgi:hypothetical protein